MVFGWFKKLKSGLSKSSEKLTTKINKVIKGKGRILVRKSGTEPKIRVMRESEDKFLLKKSMSLIVKKII